MSEYRCDAGNNVLVELGKEEFIIYCNRCLYYYKLEAESNEQ